MKAIYSICCIVLALGLVACKQGDVTTEAPQESSETNQTQVTETRQEADQSVSQGHDYNFLTHKVLVFNTVMGADDGEAEPKKGDWVNLIKDGTYQAGRQSEQTHTGKWSYDHDSQTLFLRPDTQNYKMSEWKVMATEQVMVWVGTQTYGNNAIQIQLLFSDGIPQ